MPRLSPRDSLRIAFCMRADAYEKPGGDTIQMEKTKEALEILFGHQIDILLTPDADAIRRADVVHIFNVQTTEESLSFARIASGAGIPMVLSTIYWDLRHASLVSDLARVGIVQPSSLWRRLLPMYVWAARLAASATGRRTFFHPEKRRDIQSLVGLADVLLPNSHEELRHLANYLGVRTSNFNVEVIVNAVDTSILEGAITQERRTKSPAVACVGRLEPTKNQIGLLRALERREDCEILLIGKRGRHKGYNRALDKAAARIGRVTIIDENLPQEEVFQKLRECAVHVLPSFRESPGLVSLEALALGLAVVVSQKEYCPVGTYFGDLEQQGVFTCDPYSPQSIATAVEQALEVKTAPAVRRHLARFSWTEAARQTNQGYLQALQSVEGEE